MQKECEAIPRDSVMQQTLLMFYKCQWHLKFETES